VRRIAALLVPVTGLGLVVIGIFLVYPPAGVIAAGLAILGASTFDPARAARITWPR
jgi:hypothetical protein